MSGRATRGGGSKAKPIKKKPRKKSSNKVRREDDSDVDGSEESTNKPRKAGGGFQKPFNLSAPLAEVCGGETRVRRALPVLFSIFCCTYANVSPGSTAAATSGGQEIMGAHQGQRSPRPQRQAPDYLRRKDARRLQTSEGGHVPDEQARRQPSLSCGRRVIRPRGSGEGEPSYCMVFLRLWHGMVVSRGFDERLGFSAYWRLGSRGTVV